MSTETVVTTEYHRPDVAVKLELLRNRFSYTDARMAGLYNKALTLAVIRSGELRVLEGRLELRFGNWVHFIPKGHRTADVTLNAADIIGHAGGYGHTSDVARNAKAEFDRISTEEVRALLAAREQAEQEEAARRAAEAIARICRDVQIAQEERREADAKILSLLESPEDIAQLAA